MREKILRCRTGASHQKAFPHWRWWAGREEEAILTQQLLTNKPLTTLAVLNTWLFSHSFPPLAGGPSEKETFCLRQFSLPCTLCLAHNTHPINVGISECRNECMKWAEIDYVQGLCNCFPDPPVRGSQERFIMAPFTHTHTHRSLEGILPHQRKPGLTPLSFYILRLVEFAHYFFTVRHFAYN